MPKDHSQPINEADRQARAAFSHFAKWLYRNDPFGQLPIDMDPRTWQRIARGERDVPPGVARELAAYIRAQIPAWDWATVISWAEAFELWADDCEQRSKAVRHA